MPAYITPIFVIEKHLRLTHEMYKQFPESHIIKLQLEQLKLLYYLRTGIQFEEE